MGAIFKLEAFTLGMVDKQREKKHGTLFLYMTLVAWFLYTKNGKRNIYPQWKNGI